MVFLTHPGVASNVRNILMREKAKKECDISCSLRELNKMGHYIKKREFKSHEEVTNRFACELSLTRLGLSAFVYAYLGTLDGYEPESKNTKPIRANWGSSMDSNDLIHNHIGFAINNICSIIMLCESGYDASARVISRSEKEHLLLLTNIISDELMMKAYLESPVDERELRGWWRRHFNYYKLLNGIEKALADSNVEKDAVDEILNHERNSRDMDSQLSHSGFMATYIMSHAFSINDDDRMEPALFGTPSNGVVGTLSNLCHSMFLFICMFPVMLRDRHDFIFPKENTNWTEFLCIRQCFIEVFQRYLNQKSRK